jgi:hypothetical protein
MHTHLTTHTVTQSAAHHTAHVKPHATVCRASTHVDVGAKDGHVTAHAGVTTEGGFKADATNATDFHGHDHTGVSVGYQGSDFNASVSAGTDWSGHTNVSAGFGWNW